MHLHVDVYELFMNDIIYVMIYVSARKLHELRTSCDDDGSYDFAYME